MNALYTLPLDAPNATLEVVGGKGASLTRMIKAGLPVTMGFHITTAAYREFVAANELQPQILKVLGNVDMDQPESLEIASRIIAELFLASTIPVEIRHEIEQAYLALPGSSPAVAVRSSATAEDLPEASFAGQQETYLNLLGVDAVLYAAQKCWAGLWTARAISYRSRQGISPETVSIAVVVQLLVEADAAGILFTVNPINGNRDQMLINASWGLGEAVVSGSVSPDSLTIDKSSGRVIQYQVNQKLIRTVQTDSGTIEEKVPKDLQQMAVLTEQQAAELSAYGNQIETLYGMPLDIEWALADGTFAILQARPITALPEPELPTPTAWKLPEGVYLAMRNNIVEMIADPLTPLFKTLGLRGVNNSMDRIMDQFLGDIDILPDVPIITVNEYAYYNGSLKFGHILRIFIDAGRIMKRMFTGAVERWTEKGRPEYVDFVRSYEEKNWLDSPCTQILEDAQKLAESAIDAYMLLVSGLIPAAWMSEAWFTWRYKFWKRKDEPEAAAFLMGFDSIPIQADKALYDLAQWTRSMPDLNRSLSSISTKQLYEMLHGREIPGRFPSEQWREWLDRFQVYLEEYGHMIYNLDFGSPVPTDDPKPVLEAFKMYLAGQGTNPYQRQEATATRREAAVQKLEQRLRGRRLKAFQKTLSRAQKYAPLREDGLADVGLSYPLVRQMLLEIGRRFVVAGGIEKAGDVFWLVEDEITEASTLADQGKELPDFSQKIAERKAIWKAARRAVPPLALPQIKLFGLDLMSLKSSGLRKQKENIVKGVAASPGVVSNTACVIQGPEDFSRMIAGGVLVAPLTTPAWTPLFARAGGIVTDVGGPLSHGSIVAREYGIPAVLGTGNATKVIDNGQWVTVDGSKGVVVIQEKE